MNYINKQLHGYTCGLVAIANAIKWLGGSINYHEIFNTFKGTKLCTKAEGMEVRDLNNSLKLYNIKYKKVINPSINCIERSLYRKRAVILLYTWYRNKESSGHYCFLDKSCGDVFRSYNSEKDGINIIRKKELNSWFRKTHKNGYRTDMWEIIK